jgi:hypothetical protein
MGRGWYSVQHGRIPFGLEKGCARCTTSRRTRSTLKYEKYKNYFMKRGEFKDKKQEEKCGEQ